MAKKSAPKSGSKKKKKKVGSNKGGLPREVTIDYLKGNFFQVVYADGVWGGLAPRSGNIQMNFWSERSAIPQRLVHRVTGDQKFGPEIEEKRVLRSDLVREVGVGVVMSVDTAVSLRDWLTQRIDLASEFRQKAAARMRKQQEE